MARAKGVYKAQHKLVATWVPTEDFALLQHLAFTHSVPLASYLRAILIDALEEEREKRPFKTPNTQSSLGV